MKIFLPKLYTRLEDGIASAIWLLLRVGVFKGLWFYWLSNSSLQTKDTVLFCTTHLKPFYSSASAINFSWRRSLSL